MLEKCDEKLAAWADDGDTFIVKDQEKFAAEVIPKYFEHSNFSSFARQLNFYGFKKIQMTPIQISDDGTEIPKQVKFHNMNFKKGRKDLLSNIVRSTRRRSSSTDEADGSGGTSGSSKTRSKRDSVEMEKMKAKVSYLESRLAKMEASFAAIEDRMNVISSKRMHVPEPRYGGHYWRPHHNHEGYSYEHNIPAEVTLSSSSSSDNNNHTTATLCPSPYVKDIDPELLPPAPQISATTLFRGISNESSKSHSQLIAALMADPTLF